MAEYYFLGWLVKFISRERQIIISNLGVKRWRLRCSRKGKGRAGRPGDFSRISNAHHIKAPGRLSIYEFDGECSHYESTMRFIHDIRGCQERKCIIDFSGTKSVSAAAIVVVYAALEQAGIGGHIKSGICYSAVPIVNRILKTSNISRLLAGYKISYALPSAKVMPVVSSVGRDQMEEIVDFIQKNIYEENMSAEMEHAYGDAVSETINNVSRHAYPEIPEGDKRWWVMCSTFGKELFLAIYDAGVGIPRTVTKKSWLLPLVRKFNNGAYEKLNSISQADSALDLSDIAPKYLTDAELVRYSMEGDVSRIKQDKHGQGSKSIRALVESTKGGKLWIFSNNGLCRFSDSIALVDLETKFPGTLLQWNIKLA